MGSHHSKRVQIQQNQPTLTGLLALPPEAILCIADFLPLHSAASLAFCNRTLSHLLGPQCWGPLRQRKHEARIEFLSALAKDLPGYFVCHLCSLLHLNSGVHSPGPTESRSYPQNLLRCVWNDKGLCHRFYRSPYVLSFAHVQLAMKRHHYGPDHGVSLNSLSYFEVEERVDEEYCTTVLLSIDARIVSDELFMRCQQWMVLPTDERDKLLSMRSPVYPICQHIWDNRKDREVWRLIRRCLDNLDGGQTRSTIIGTLQCQLCYMDFEIGIKDLGARGTALVFTRWLNLGAGLTPSDNKWRSHFVYSDNYPISFSPGSIRSSFEEQTGSSVDELASENMKKLFSNYKHTRGRCGPDGYAWILYREGLWYIASWNKENTKARSPRRYNSVIAGGFVFSPLNFQKNALV